MRGPAWVVPVALVCSAAPMSAVADITLGQIDTFVDGTTQGWSAGSPHPAPPSNISSGGPAGAGDNYLRLTAIGGNGPGSRLATFNGAQWAGDYTAAGVTQISLDVRNFGPADAILRLMVWDVGPGSPTNAAVTTAGALVPAGGDWTTISFAVDAASLTTLLGSAAAALSGATELRLFHNPEPAYSLGGEDPPPVNIVLGVDNVRALPGPSGAMLAMGGLAVLGVRRRR